MKGLTKIPLNASKLGLFLITTNIYGLSVLRSIISCFRNILSLFTPFPLKSSENLRFSDDLLNIRSEIWQRSLTASFFRHNPQSHVGSKCWEPMHQDNLFEKIMQILGMDLPKSSHKCLHVMVPPIHPHEC